VISSPVPCRRRRRRWAAENDLDDHVVAPTDVDPEPGGAGAIDHGFPLNREIAVERLASRSSTALVGTLR
jgi:hypothetical protein